MSIDHRLATYGSLAPGRPNHHQLSELQGHWQAGVVRGHLIAEGWGAAIGFPALRLAGDGDPVDVQIFESAGLPKHWFRLDAFEGSEYHRVAVNVETSGGSLEAWIYVSASPAA
jgi:gamma-glutamylcyclotransferase (GGCT)/AIG2-like uncharacterized protein YtfP